MLAGHTTSTPVFPLVVQVVVKMANHIFDGLVSPLWVEGILDGFRCLYQVVDIDARSIAEDSPEETRKIKEESLDEKHYRYPLVVTYVLLDHTRLSSYSITW